MNLRNLLFVIIILKLGLIFSFGKSNIDSLINKADQYFLNNYDSSSYYYRTVLGQSNITPKQKFHCLSNLSVIYHDIGEVDTSINIIYRAIEIGIRNRYYKSLSEAYLRLGNYFKEIDDINRAKQFYIKSIEINKNKGGYGALGILYSHLQQTDSARFFLNLSADLYLKSDTSNTNNKIALSSIYGQIAITFFDEEENNKGFEYLHKSLDLAIEIRHSINIISAMLNLSSAHSMLGELEDAERYLTQSISIADTSGNLRIQKNITQRLYEFYYEIGKYKLAYNYLSRYILQKDSLTKIKYSDQLKEKELNYIKEIQRQKIKNIQSENKKQQVIYILFGAVLILFLLLIIIVFYTKFRSKKAEASTLQKKSDLLEFNLKKAADIFKELNKTISEQNLLIEELQKKYENIDTDNDDELKELLEKQKIIRNEDWNKYVKTFNLLFPNFLKKILSEFPNLTEGDTRQIIMLKLDYSREKSGLIIGISPNSIKRARQRLSKKMNLDNVNNLYKYIAHS